MYFEFNSQGAQGTVNLRSSPLGAYLFFGFLDGSLFEGAYSRGSFKNFLGGLLERGLLKMFLVAYSRGGFRNFLGGLLERGL